MEPNMVESIRGTLLITGGVISGLLTVCAVFLYFIYDELVNNFRGNVDKKSMDRR